MISKPKGCHDIYGTEGKKWQYVNKVIDSLMEKYNYEFIRTPIFESSEVFHRGMGESTDVVKKETYDFTDRGNRKMTLRPEGTAGIVRSYIENKMYGNMSSPVKLYYNGTMYRYERPQSGRDRELTQFGIELLGSDDPFTDAEIISIPVNLYKMLGLREIKVKINSLGDNESRNNYREALKEYFRPYLEELCPDCKERFEKNPLRILDCKVDKDSDILKNAPITLDYLNEDSKKRFEKVKEYLEALEVDYEIDTRLVRGLDYYNHTVFEIEAHVEGFGSNNVLGGGGRYNGLVEMLGGPSTPAVGFACGFGRLMMALDLENIKLPIKENIEIFVMHVSETEKNYAATLVQSLRMSGFRVETEYTGRSLKSQFKQADRLGARYLIILNDEDLMHNELKIKNNKTKEEVTIGLDYLLYYLDEVLLEDEIEESEENYMNRCTCGDDCHCTEEENCGCLEEHTCHCGDECSCGHHDEEHECGCSNDCKCKHEEE